MWKMLSEDYLYMLQSAAGSEMWTTWHITNSQCSHTSVIIHYRKFAHTTTTCAQNNIHVASKNTNICGNIGSLDSCPYNISHRVISIAISGIAEHLTDKQSCGKMTSHNDSLAGVLNMDDFLLCKAYTVAMKYPHLWWQRRFQEWLFNNVG